MTALPVLLPVAVLSAGVLAVLASLLSPRLAKAVAVVGAASGFGLAVTGLVAVIGEGPIHHELGGWPPPIGIEYVLDPLSAFIALIVTAIGLLAVVYPNLAGFDFEPTRGSPLHALVLLLLAGLLGVVVSGDLFHLFVFLEIYAIATYALVATGGDRAVFASFRYLLIGTAGSGLYLIGVGFVYFSTGSLNMADLAGLLPELTGSPSIIGALVLITMGLAVKMALFPLHVWLPDAHANAPPAVAALLAAVQVKVGAYALIRVLNQVFGTEFALGTLPVGDALVWFGAAGILVGSVLAITQSDFKRLLAYSTVAQLGYIGVGIGLGTPLALVGALLHVLNHAVMKSALFFIAGGIYSQTKVREISKFAGLGARMPWLMAAFTVAAAGMVGIPPTAGFFSKFYLVLASVDEGLWPLAIVVVASSLLTAAYFLRVIEQVWTKEPIDAKIAASHEPTPGVLVPVVILAVAVLAIGIGNLGIVDGLLSPLAEDVVGAL